MSYIKPKSQRGRRGDFGLTINNDGIPHFTTPQSQNQPFKIVYAKDITWRRFGNIWQLKNSFFIRCGKLPKPIGGIYGVTIQITEDNRIMGKHQSWGEWCKLLESIKCKGAIKREDIAYIEIEIDDIRQALGV